ncbi:hotdog family protein [uncultured Vibrio sp.]|uniref:hotdog family protein n=1 Tax=uncultured Vibrio sp. TaxID=114054 RepID=UPI0025D6E336|nr:hotdog family protein [uncultured Vibrio sp.]
MNNIPSVEELLPHDEPMILIDRVLSIDVDSIRAQVDIGSKNPFYNEETQTIPAYVGIEFMAQAIAAWSGYHAIAQSEQPPIGFLLGSRRYHTLCDAFSNGQVIDIYAEQVMESNGMAVFSADLEHQGVKIATAQLNVYVPSEQKLQEMKMRSQA